ncbi:MULTISPECIES: CBO0543 family protein [unclassified Bacillus (in: firmicutes)]|uniref:CBO0543 family protein n=1 Tax=unclassified Bacillus (in: firmicutes) TaxID=185979 RepID=UPI0008F08D0B|nr:MULTISPECIES: CBO0543 family protein [unclassified Bacillus (in: firmicutes)]SFB13224.1 hypothetical protein SAMN02799634_106177 [Bacillus sp. UNCCL13]SFQ90070.1 hypothetical protein SAMN04488577_3642 [Bacillus sp. cl95]
MYLLLVVAVYIFFAKYFVDWKRWEEYYPTILYFIVCNLTYNFVFYDHTLWMYKAKSGWLNHTIIDLVFSYFIIPVIIMIYLRFFPTGRRKYIYLVAWIAYFSVIEWLFAKKGLFVYENGWNLKWSIMFNIIMFTLLRVHFKKPILALALSFPIIVVLLIFFHPPFSHLK